MKKTNTKEYKELVRKIKSNQLKLEKDLISLSDYTLSNTDITNTLWNMSDRMKKDREYIRNVMPK